MGMDIQIVFNHYKAGTYMCACFSKSKDEMLEAMKQAAKEPLHGEHMQQKKNVSSKKLFILSCLNFGCVRYFQE